MLQIFDSCMPERKREEVLCLSLGWVVQTIIESNTGQLFANNIFSVYWQSLLSSENGRYALVPSYSL